MPNTAAPQYRVQVVQSGAQWTTKVIPEETVKQHGNSGASLDVDLNDGYVHSLTLSANCTITISNPPSSGMAVGFTLFVTQDGTGSRTITWPGSVAWQNGTEPTLSTAAAAIDILTFTTIDGGTTWHGFMVGKGMA